MKSQLAIALTVTILTTGARDTLADCSESKVCSTNNLKVCICLDNSSDVPAPILDYEFTANNGVDLKKGRDESDTLLQWRVWAEDGNGGTADLGPVRTPASDDFDVKILDDGGGPGCLDVAKIELDPTGSGDFSNLSGASISGDVNGLIFLQKDISGNGGVASNINIIGGTVSGNVTIPHLQGSLLISVDMDGEVDIDEIGTAGKFSLSGSVLGAHTLTFDNIVGDLYVGGSVAGDATIEIQDLGDASDGGSVNINGAYMTGTLLLTTGIDNSAAEVNVAYPKGVIDLNGYDVAGRLEVGFPYTSAQIVNGGQVTSTGRVTYGLLQGFDPEGSATFAGVAAGGEIRVDNDVNLKGRITITGDMDGSITLTNDLESVYGRAGVYGAIHVGGDLGGSIDVQGDVISYAEINVGDAGEDVVDGTIEVGGVTDHGAINIAYDLDGQVKVEGDLDANSTINVPGALGGKIVVEGSVGAGSAINVGGNMIGTFVVDGDLSDSGEITLNAMTATGTLTIYGACDGDIAVNDMSSNTFILCKSSLGSTGSILGGYDDGTIAGNIVVGSLSGDPVTGD